MKNALQCFTHVYINYCHRIDDVIEYCTIIDNYSLNRFTHQKWNTFNILHDLSVFLNLCSVIVFTTRRFDKSSPV